MLPQIEEHPLRRSLTEEMHLRQMPPFCAPARVLQFVQYTHGLEHRRVRQHAVHLAELMKIETPIGDKYFHADFGSYTFVWEQHTEIATYTFIQQGSFEDPFLEAVFPGVPVDWLNNFPGKLLRATQIALLPRSLSDPANELLRQWFDLENLFCCDLQEGEARLWSNFRVHPNGFGRLLLQDRGLTGQSDPSQLVQRLQELGNYRNLALLGLSMAHSLGPRLDAMERRLSEITNGIAAGTVPDDALLSNVSQLAAELTELSSSADFRMSATRAYASIVSERLDSCGVRRIQGYRSLRDFTERRLIPAARTCESLLLRIKQLAEHTTWTSSLLRTRIETSLEAQNAALLASMDRRAQVQLKLQQAVEGLSVIAITYYATGIISYIVKGIWRNAAAVNRDTLIAAIVPIAFLATWISICRLRSRHSNLPHSEA